METLSLGSDEELEDIVAGRVPTGRDDLAPLVELVGALRAAEPVPSMGAELRALLDGEVGIVVSFRARRTRRVLVATAAGVAALVGATGVAAAGNVLPAALQDVVASAGDAVGLDVPRSGERGHAGEDPQPDHGKDDKGHDPKGPKDESPSDTAPGKTGDAPGTTAKGKTGDTPATTAPAGAADTPATTAPASTGATTPAPTPTSVEPRGGPDGVPGADAKTDSPSER